MGNLSQLWQLTNVSDIAPRAVQRAAVRGVLQSVHQLVTGLGWTPPSNVTAPSTWPDDVPLSTINAWEVWYDSVAPAATLPPSSILATPTPTANAWSASLALARDRNAPRAVSSYLSVQSTLWETLRNAFTGHPLGADVTNALANAERALQAWWFQRLGGATGTPAPFPPPPQGMGNPDVPGRTPTSTGSTSSGLKVVVALTIGYVLSKALKRR